MVVINFSNLIPIYYLITKNGYYGAQLYLTMLAQLQHIYRFL